MRGFLALLLSFALAVSAGCASHGALVGVQSERRDRLALPASVDMGYLLYLPDGFDAAPDKRWPMVVFLHGRGESGTDLSKVAVHGPPKFAAAGQSLPFVLLSPQCPAGQNWNITHLEALLDSVLKQHVGRIDRDRIYITGLSMGGGGAWEWLARPTHPFAAGFVVCGAAFALPIRIYDPVPVWAVHGDKDDVVPPFISHMAASVFHQAGAEVRLSIYPGVNHGAWERGYTEPDLWPWLLSHTKRPPPAPARTFFQPSADFVAPESGGSTTDR
jgi:predicted peptidase